MIEPPRIVRWPRWRVPAVVVAVALAAALVLFWREFAAWIAAERDIPSGEPVAFYTCSMDPSIESDRPGSCPLCGMALTPVSHEDRASGIVRIPASARVRIGLRVAPVETLALRQRVTALGEIVGPAPEGRAAVIARVYRDDANDVPPGHPVSVVPIGQSLTELTGAIVAPLAGDPPGRLRAEIDNPDHALRAGMHIEMHIDRELPARLVVPARAVLYAGVRRIVFVDRGGGRFEPRTPKLGIQAAGFVEVLEGLAAGDQVVVEGTFLVAAESRIRSDGVLWGERPELVPPRRPRPEPTPERSAR